MVTGVEAAGLVLATIPLLLATLEIYAKGISVTKRYLRYSKPFNGLLEDLRAEQTIYDNTIQILLIGVVSQNDMSEFLANPGSDRWKLPKFEEKLKARLGRSYSSYMDTITRMDSTTVDFKHRLKFDKSEPSHLIDIKFFKEHYKRLKFSLQSSDYADLITRLRQSNSTLHRLTTQTMTLESLQDSQNLKSKMIRSFHKIRERAFGCYSALETGWKCTCRVTHSVNLRLGPQMEGDDMSEEEDSEEADILPESFHLLLGYDNRLSGKRTDVAQPWHWEEVNVRLTRMRVAPKSSPLLPKVVKSKGVRFDKNNQRSKLDVHGLSHPPQPVKDLCQAISSLKRPRTNLSFELQSIDPLTQKYGIRIYPLRTTPFLPEDWSLSSMNKAVCDPNFTKQARLRSGVTLAYSVLQFYSTPWISSALEKDNIFFLERSETSTFTDIFLSRTLRRPDERDSESTPDLLRRTIRNQALYSLGILLIEIWYGETLQGLHRPEDGALDTGDPIKEFLAMSNTADRLLQDLHDQAGAKYTEAVRRCLRCEFGNLDCNLDNFQFQRAVYNGVVSRLQENLEFLYLDTSD